MPMPPRNSKRPSIDRTIVLFGGTGFVGRHLAERLVADNWTIRIPTRHANRHRALAVSPSIEVLEADIHDPVVQSQLLSGCSAAINLVGILNEARHGGEGFRKAHTELTGALLDGARDQGVRRFIQMSALKADMHEPPSYYLRSKQDAENLVLAARNVMDVTVFRPSVIFGADDSFLNRFAALVKFAPVFPLGRAEARFAPIFVGDVVAHFAAAIDDPGTFGKAFDLCGPETYSLREIVENVGRWTGHRTRVIGLSDALAKIQARSLELVPGKPLSRDNLASLSVDSVCEGEAAGTSPLSVLGPLCLRPGRHEAELQRMREAYIDRARR